MLLLAFAGLIFLGVTVLSQMPYEDQFAIPWAAGRTWLLEGESPYSESVGQHANIALINASYEGQLPENQTFNDLIFNLFFYLPFSLLPFRISRAIWFALSVIVLGLIGYFSLKLSEWKVKRLEKILLIAMVVFSYPGLQAYFLGNLTPVIVLLLLIALDALIHGKDTLAGLLLSLTFGAYATSALIVLFLIIWSITRRRWGVLKAYFAGLAFLWAISLLLIPAWPTGWFRAVFSLFETWDWVQTPLMDLSRILPGIAQPLSLSFHAVFAVVLLTVCFTTFTKTGLEFRWKVLAIFVLTFLFNIQSSNYSLFLVLPAFYLVLRFWSDRWKIVGRILSWMIAAGFTVATWVLAGPDISFLFGQRFPSLIAGMPIAVLAGLVTIRWWAIKKPRLPYDSD